MTNKKKTLVTLGAIVGATLAIIGTITLVIAKLSAAFKDIDFSNEDFLPED